MIRTVKRHGKTYYQLRSVRTGRVLGTHPSRRLAARQELAIRLSELRAEGRIPKRTRARRRR